MGLRIDLQALLESVADNPDNVYFQEETNIIMEFPAILYERDYRYTIHANNSPYHSQKRYTVTCISRDPDSAAPDKVAMLPTAVYDRYQRVDGLHHDIFNIYF